MYGINLQVMYANWDQLSGEQQAQLMHQTAIDAGMTYTDAAGNVVAGLEPPPGVMPGMGAPGTIWGIKWTTGDTIDQAITFGLLTNEQVNELKTNPFGALANTITTQLESTVNSAVDAFSSGQPMTADQAKALAFAAMEGVATGINAVEYAPWQNTGVVRLVGDGTSGWQRYILDDAALTWATENEGGLYVSGSGNVYEIVGAWNPPNTADHRLEAGYITMRDVVTGQTYNVTGAGDSVRQARNWSGLVTGVP